MEEDIYKKLDIDEEISTEYSWKLRNLVIEMCTKLGLPVSYSSWVSHLVVAVVAYGIVARKMSDEDIYALFQFCNRTFKTEFLEQVVQSLIDTLVQMVEE